MPKAKYAGTHLIQLVIGDCSGDGHEKTEVVTIESNLDRTQFMKLMDDKRVQKLFDRRTVCSEYKERSLDPATSAKMVELGFADEDDTELGRLPVWGSEYAIYLLETMKHVNPKFKYEFSYLPTIDIGGYGAVG